MLDCDLLIVGGGLGGLCAAAGLRGSGLRVLVADRDAGLASRAQGYRINIDPTGEAALRACLPAAHFALYRDTAHRQLDPSVDIFGSDLRPLLHRAAEATPDGLGPAPGAVDRATLRRILADAAGTSLRPATEIVAVDPLGDEVVVRTGGGERLRAGLVVAADGAGSGVRRQHLPGHDPRALGTVAIYGRAPLDPTALTWIPRGVLEQRFVGVTDTEGTTLALGAWHPRVAPAEAARRRLPGLDLAAPDPYVMWVLLVPRDTFPATVEGPSELHAEALRRLRDWDPAATRFVRDAVVDDTFLVDLRAAPAVPAWPAGRVTFLGDAIHAVSPAGGQGANTALADAAALVAEVRRGGPTPEAVARYEDGLRVRARAVLGRSRAYGAPVPSPAGAPRG